MLKRAKQIWSHIFRSSGTTSDASRISRRRAFFESLEVRSLLAQVLVFGDRPGDQANLTTALTTLGHTVTNVPFTSFPGSLASFDVAYGAQIGTPLTATQLTSLQGFVQSGRGLYMTGERPCCEPANASVTTLVNSLVIGGGVTVGGQGDIGGPYTVNPSAVGNISINPNALTTWTPFSPGGLAGVSGSNVLISGAGGIPVGAVWGPANMVGGAGMLTVLMDVNWLSSLSGANLNLLQNMQVALQTPSSGLVYRTGIDPFAEQGLQAFEVYNVATNTWQSLGTTNTSANLAVSQTGELYMLEESTNMIQRYNPGSNTWTNVRPGPPTTVSFGNLEVTNAGEFFVTDSPRSGGGAPVIWYTSGGSWLSAPLPGSPSAIGDYDPATNTLVIAQNNSEVIWSINPTTLAITTFNVGANSSTGETRRFGEIYNGFWYTQSGSGQIRRFDLSNNAIPIQNVSPSVPVSFYESAAVNPATGTFYLSPFNSTQFHSWDPISTVFTPLATALNPAVHNTLAFVGSAVAAPNLTLDGSNNLLFTDLTGTTNDNLTIQSDNANSRFVINSTSGNLVTTIAGATGSGTSSVTIPFGSVAGPQIIINTAGGNDTLTQSFSLGNFSKTVVFNGGGNADTLNFSGGGAFTTATFNYTNSTDGSVAIDANNTIYTGLSPISSTINAANVILNYSTTAETITATAGPPGQTTVASTAGETTTFNNPTVSLAINAGNTGNDNVTVTALGSGFNAALTIDGGTGTDNVTISPALNLTAPSAGLTVSGETISLNGGSITTSGNQTYNGAVTLGSDTTATGANVTFNGTVNSGVGTGDFQILTLTANNSNAIEANFATGDDRGGIAVSPTQVFLQGDGSGNGQIGRFSALDLTGGTPTASTFDGLTMDLATETVYALGTGPAAPVGAGPGLSFSGNVTHLLQIDGNTGALTGASIALSTPIALTGGCCGTVGIFAGYGRIVILDSVGVAREVAIPTGAVSTLGTPGQPSHFSTENWAYFGVAERFGGQDYVAFGGPSPFPVTQIQRMRISDGAVSTVASFSNLSDLASFTISTSRNRWYFHYEGSGQFGSRDETIGYADATFTTTGTGVPRSLTVNSPGGTIFGGAVGQVSPLVNLTTDAGGTTALNGGAVTTTGNQTYGDAVILGADTTTSSTGGNVIFNNTVNSGGASVELLTNGSFETGTYAGWLTQDLSNPFSPLTVRGSGFTTGFGFYSTSPTDGAWASFDGFDGNGPGNIRLAQDVAISAAPANLSFDYRAAWDMLNYGGSTQARLLNVIVQPVGGGPDLLNTNILSAAPGSANFDTGNLTANVNLGAFAGQSVRIIIDQFIPQNFTGPAQMQIDRVSLIVGGGGPRSLTVNAASTSTFGGAVGGIDPLSTLSVTAASVTAGSIATTTAVNISNTDAASAITGVMSGTGSTLTKTGTGTLTLSGASTYTGVTNINTGVLRIAGSGTISTASTINVNNTGTLRFGRNDTWGNHTSDVSSPIIINAGGVVESGGFYNTLVNLTMNGGVLALTGGVNLSFPAFALKGTVTVGGSQASQINVVSGANNLINVGDDTLGPTVFNVANSTGDANTDLVVNAPLKDNAFGGIGITKTGVGTMTLTAANTYGGPTAINAGTLLVNGTNSGTGLTSANTTGVLGGTGSLAGPATINSTGRLAAGNSPETLATGSLTLTAGSFFDVEIGGTTAGTQYDQVNVTGTVSLGNANLNLIQFSGFSVSSGVLQTYTIITNDSTDAVTGTFNGLPEGAPVTYAGGTVYVSYNGGDGNDVVLNSQPVVNGGGGGDTLVLRQVSGNPALVEFSFNAAPFVQVTSALPFTFNGNAGTDLMLVDVLNGDPISTGNVTFTGEILNVQRSSGAPSDAATYQGSGTGGTATVTLAGFGSINASGTTVVDFVNLTSVNVQSPTANDTWAVADSATGNNGGAVPAGYSIASVPALAVSGLSTVVTLRGVGTSTLDTVTGGSNGNDTININSGTTAHGNTNLTITTSTGTDVVTVAGALTAGGNITISSQNIAVNATLTGGAAGTANLNAGAGAITTSGAGVDVITQSLIAAATTGINLDTTVTNITATNSGAGSINLDETDGVTLQNVTAANGTITFTTTSTTPHVVTVENVNSGAQNTTMTLADGDLVSGAGDVGVADIVANQLTLTLNTPGAGGHFIGVSAATRLEIDVNQLQANIVDGPANSAWIVNTAGNLTMTDSSLAANGTTVFDVLVQNGSLLSVVGGPGDARAVQVILAVTGAGSTIGASAAAPFEVNAATGFAGALVNASTAGGANDHIYLRDVTDNFPIGVINAGAADAFLTTTVGSIIDNASDALLDITAARLVLSASGGIGISPNGNLETQVGSLEATGGTGGVFLANTGNLIIGGISGATGVSATGGDIVVSTAGSMTVTENVTATGAGTDVTLTTVDAVAAGQNLTVNGGVVVSSAAASITLNAGDNATITGNLTSATLTTINIDAGDAESAGPTATAGDGGTLSITGVITTPLSPTGGAYLNGGNDFDLFTFNPQTTTEFFVDGGLPVGTATGDILQMNVTATVNPNLTVPGSNTLFNGVAYNGPGSGAFTFDPAHRTVRFKSIEDAQITGSYHLTYDNTVAPVAHIVVMLDGTPNPNERLQFRDGSNAGPVLYQTTLAPILSVRVLGGAGADMVTVDDINGLPSFGGSVPLSTGVGNNPRTSDTDATPAPEFYFNAGGGVNVLNFNLNQSTTSQQYAIGTGTAPGNSEGEVQSTNASTGLNAYFSGVSQVNRTGLGAAPGTLTVFADDNANTISIANNGGGETRVDATGYVPFDFSGNNYSAIVVNALAGDDLVDLISFGGLQNNHPLVTLNGGTETDTLRVRSTSGNTGLVTLNGNAGDDLFQLFDAANTVDNIAGQVVVDGTDGNVGGNTDTLTIVDRGDGTFDNVLIAAVNPAASADYFLEGSTSAAPNDVIFRNIDVLNFTGTSDGDTIDGRFVNTVPPHDLNTVNLSGWVGADQFLLFISDQIGGGGVGFTPTGVASGVASVNLFGDAPGNPNGVDGNDVFGATPVGLTGTGVSNVGLVVPNTTRMIRPSASTTIAIDGGQPTGLIPPMGDEVGDVLNTDISALPNTTPVIVSTFSPGTVVAPGIQPFTWTQIEDINLVDQGKLTNVQMGDLFARTTPGADLIQVMRNPTLLNPNQVRLRINATIGNYSVSNKTIMYGGGMNDTITQSNLTVPAEFYGEDGDDYLSGAMNNDWLVGGNGNDRINGSGGDNIIWGDNAPTLPSDPNPQDLAVGGDDQLSGLGGADVFYAGGGNDLVNAGGGNDYVNGGFGNDNLGGDDGDDRLYGGPGNDTLSGHTGNDLLTGAGGDDFLYGNSGNDVIFGGVGLDTVDGGDGNDLLVSGSVANETTSRTSLANTSTYSSATYTNGTDNDAALLSLLTGWGSTSSRTGIGAISHDGVDDDLFGGLGDDDFCWELPDLVEDPLAVSPSDFNAVGMGTDERFAPIA